MFRGRRWSPKLAVGRRGEDLAHRFLQSRGFVIVARNYRLSTGEAEADLIAWEGDALVFVEVKTRETADFGPPERAIGEEKRDHLIKIARAYTRKSATPWDRVRFDVIGIVLTEPPTIEHFRDALPARRRRASA
ncbi:MAG TPA: YraN family protein [Bryobacteraceae bacterium]|nr:YraN family protein [Bryobacteraceae bacterium]